MCATHEPQVLDEPLLITSQTGSPRFSTRAAADGNVTFLSSELFTLTLYVNTAQLMKT